MDLGDLAVLEVDDVRVVRATPLMDVDVGKSDLSWLYMAICFSGRCCLLSQELLITEIYRSI